MRISTKSDFTVQKNRKQKPTAVRLEIIAIFIISLAIFSLPSLLRWTYFDNPSIIGFPTYLHQRQAQDMDGYDELSFGGRDYTYPPLFSLGIALFGMVLPIEIAGLLFVSVLGAVGIVFFCTIVYEHITKKYALLSTVLLILVPGTIYFNSHLSSRAPPFALGMAALYFLLKFRAVNRKNNRNIIIAGILLGIAALFHPETAIFFGIVALFRAMKHKKIFFAFALAAIIAMSYYVPFLALHGLPEANALHEEYRLRSYSLEPTTQAVFFELAPNGYLTFPIAALAVFGLAKKRHVFFASWLIVALALAIIAERFAVYLAVPVVFLAVYAVLHVENKKWFKIALVLLLIYSVAFAAAKIIYFAQAWPTNQQYQAMLWLRENTPENATVLSDWQWGHWINGIAERRNFVDGYAEYAPNATLRIQQLQQFYTNCSVPDGYNITHIYMEQWFAEGNNISCLGQFRLAYEDSGLLIYTV